MKKFLLDECAVSTALGAVLIMGILVSASTIYLSIQVPEWTKDFEAEHADEVPHDFAKLTSDIDMAVLSKDPTASASTPIGMIPKRAPLVGIYATGGKLRFNQNEGEFQCIACSPTEAEPAGNGYWNSSSDAPVYNFSTYDKFHVKISELSGVATLEPEAKKDIIIKKNTTVPSDNVSSEEYCDNFIVKNNSTLTINGGMLTIHALQIIVEAGSKITADGEGWGGGSGNAPGKNGSGIGGGGGGNIAAGGPPHEKGGAGGGGGGYGGKGGAGGGTNAGSGGTNYSSEDMGSGGGGGGDWKNTSGIPILGSGGDGEHGGGLISLEASVVNIGGVITANGSDGEGKEQYPGEEKNFKGGGGGGGSGGYIVIKGDAVNITGMLHAVGGNGGSSESGSGGGGGGGGIIKVFNDSSIYPDVNTVNNSINVSGGSGGSGDEWAGINGNDGKKEVSSSPFIATTFYYGSGYLVSNITEIQGHIGYDTEHKLICYGNLTYNATIPLGTDIVIKVRTSMDENMSDAIPWEDCPPVANDQDISDSSSVSDGHRYIQWRAGFLTFDPRRTPVLRSINIAYEYGKRPVLVSSSGCIEFDSQYLYLPNYKLIHAHGATIKNQTGAEFMLLSPPFSISKEGNVAKLKITSINFIGSEKSVSGKFSSTVKSSYQEAKLVTGGLNYYNLTLNITTDYPTSWRKWFNDTCKEAGLEYGTNPGNYNYNLTGNGHPLQIIFYGNASRPVNLWLKRAEAEIKIK